jgi:hypothetical protein
VPYARKVEVYDDPRLTGVLPEMAAPDVPLIRRWREVTVATDFRMS